MHLGKRGKSIENIQTDFGDGIKLVDLLEVISAEPLGKFNKNPKMKIHKIQNVNIGLDFIAKKGVKLWGISSEDIVDENLKLILGMIWTIILRFAIADISEEELNAKEALLLWCKKKTAGYDGVKVENFHNSWADGLALCALIHAHRPDLIDFNSLDKSDKRGNIQKAFDVSEKELGITKLLDVEDLVDVPKPDERSVMTYIAQFYHVFSANRKNEIAGRRIGKLVDLTKTNDELKHDYEKQASEHSKWLKDTTEKLGDREFGNSLDEIKKLLSDLNKFKSEEKPPKVADKLALATLNNTIQVKLSSAGHPPYNPPNGLSTSDINNQWNDLEKAQALREEALLAELARQQLLDLLARRFNNKAIQLENWIKQQQEELSKEDNIDNVEAAEKKLKALEVFKAEYEQNKDRLKELHSIKDEYCKNNGKDKEPITERANKIQNDFDSLNDLINKKSSNLNDSLSKQQAMEELRKKFANAAKEYNLWVKETNGDLSSTVFPDSLEGCENYKSNLDENDSLINSSNNEKKKNLDDLWEEEKNMGITSNPYTIFTNDDILSWYNSVNDSINERRKSYENELERQRLNEEKRKEFANEAQSFIDNLENRKNEINNLTGEPNELINLIKSNYNDGKNEKENLDKLSNLQDEMSKMGIMENRHTPYTIPILNVHNDNLSRYIRNRISALEEEGNAKKEYNENARKLINWINETKPNIRSEFDNTLDGIKSIKEKWNNHKTTDRAQRGLDKIHLETLYNKIQSSQESNNRPKFEPEDELKIENIKSIWDNYFEEGKKWENEINQELSRQEKLFMQVKHFNSEADELQSKIDNHNEFLNRNDDINNLDESRIQLMTMDVFDEDYKSSIDRLNLLKSRSEKIKNLNYNNQSSIDSRVNDLEEKLNQIKLNSSEKREKLKSENDNQEKKESLRIDFAKKAKSYEKFVRDSKFELDDKNFGTTLDSVKENESKLDESDKNYISKSDEKKNQCINSHNELLNNNISDLNNHTDKSIDDINRLYDELNNAIESRRNAYNDELKRQIEFDNERKQWAENAKSFIDDLDNQKKSIKEVSGTPEEKTQKVKEIFNEGNELKEKLENLNNSNTEMREKGIYGNDYTPYTMNALQKRLQQHVTAVNNILSYYDEEKEFIQREKDNEKQWQEKQELEQRRLDFEFKCKNLIMFIDSIQDILTDPINASSIQEVEDLQKEFESAANELSSKQSDYDEIQNELKSLNDNGINVSSDITTSKWNDANSQVSSRRDQISSALEKQKENDKLSKEFADKANNVDKWIENSSSTLGSSSGDLDAQLQAIRDLNLDEGYNLLSELEEIARKLAEADVRTNPYTELNVPSIKARIDELNSSKKSKTSVIEKEILSKKHSTASPEQIEEFKEVFAHFDKNKTNSLNSSEFKSCLQSLGEDPSDSEMEQLMNQLGTKNGDDPSTIGFENFLNHMIKITSDTTTENEISQAFRDLAQDKDFITADDLRRSGMPTEKIDYLLSEMPAFEGIEGGYDYKKWAQSAFSR